MAKHPKHVQFNDESKGVPQELQLNLLQHGNTIGNGSKFAGNVRRQNGHCNTGEVFLVSNKQSLFRFFPLILYFF
jgi:hypothetical protein